MTKIRTLSRSFLSDHPLSGVPTYFVEGFLNSLHVNFESKEYLQKLIQLNQRNIKLKKIKISELVMFHKSLIQFHFYKYHTVRGGNHFKAGDLISIRCWLNKPYTRCQIILWDDIPIKNVWDFERLEETVEGELNSDEFFINGKKIKNYHALKQFANNDGLQLQNFHWWFNKPFVGQVICWSDEISY